MSEKLPLSPKLCYFRRSRFSQCLLSTALHCSLTSQFYAQCFFEKPINVNSCTPAFPCSCGLKKHWVKNWVHISVLWNKIKIIHEFSLQNKSNQIIVLTITKSICIAHITAKSICAGIMKETNLCCTINLCAFRYINKASGLNGEAQIVKQYKKQQTP